MVHSLIAPSAASRWVECAGSVSMQQRYPETEESQASREGTAAHWVGEQMLKDIAVAPNVVAPNGVTITDEIIDSAAAYTHGILTRYHYSVLNIECKIKAPDIHPDSEGTLDLWVFDPKENLLIVRDYKHGFGIVEAFENWQLINYAAGVIPTLHVPESRLKVRFEICQPRAFHPKGPERVWQIKAVDLRPYFNILHNAAHAALGDNPQLKTGEHCVYCSARHACPALQRSTKAILDFVLQAVPEEMTPEAVASEYEILKHAADLVKYRLTGIEAQAVGLIKSGRYVPGYVLEPGRGKTVWSKSLKEIYNLGTLEGIELRKEGAITPLQAIDKGMSTESVKACSETETGALKLTPVTETLAYKAFGGK